MDQHHRWRSFLSIGGILKGNTSTDDEVLTLNQVKRIVRMVFPIRMQHNFDNHLQQLLLLVMSKSKSNEEVKALIFPSILQFVETMDSTNLLWISSCESGFAFNFLVNLLSILSDKQELDGMILLFIHNIKLLTSKLDKNVTDITEHEWLLVQELIHVLAKSPPRSLNDHAMDILILMKNIINYLTPFEDHVPALIATKACLLCETIMTNLIEELQELLSVNAALKSNEFIQDRKASLQQMAKIAHDAALVILHADTKVSTITMNKVALTTVAKSYYLVDEVSMEFLCQHLSKYLEQLSTNKLRISLRSLLQQRIQQRRDIHTSSHTTNRSSSNSSSSSSVMVNHTANELISISMIQDMNETFESFLSILQVLITNNTNTVNTTANIYALTNLSAMVVKLFASIFFIDIHELDDELDDEEYEDDKKLVKNSALEINQSLMSLLENLFQILQFEYLYTTTHSTTTTASHSSHTTTSLQAMIKYLLESIKLHTKGHHHTTHSSASSTTHEEDEYTIVIEFLGCLTLSLHTSTSNTSFQPIIEYIISELHVLIELTTLTTSNHTHTTNTNMTHSTLTSARKASSNATITAIPSHTIILSAVVNQLTSLIVLISTPNESAIVETISNMVTISDGDDVEDRINTYLHSIVQQISHGSHVLQQTKEKLLVLLEESIVELKRRILDNDQLTQHVTCNLNPSSSSLSSVVVMTNEVKEILYIVKIFVNIIHSIITLESQCVSLQQRAYQTLTDIMLNMNFLSDTINLPSMLQTVMKQQKKKGKNKLMKYNSKDDVNLFDKLLSFLTDLVHLELAIPTTLYEKLSKHVNVAITGIIVLISQLQGVYYQHTTTTVSKQSTAITSSSTIWNFSSTVNQITLIKIWLTFFYLRVKSRHLQWKLDPSYLQNKHSMVVSSQDRRDILDSFTLNDRIHAMYQLSFISPPLLIPAVHTSNNVQETTGNHASTTSKSTDLIEEFLENDIGLNLLFSNHHDIASDSVVDSLLSENQGIVADDYTFICQYFIRFKHSQLMPKQVYYYGTIQLVESFRASGCFDHRVSMHYLSDNTLTNTPAKKEAVSKIVKYIHDQMEFCLEDYLVELELSQQRQSIPLSTLNNDEGDEESEGGHKSDIDNVSATSHITSSGMTKRLSDDFPLVLHYRNKAELELFLVLQVEYCLTRLLDIHEEIRIQSMQKIILILQYFPHLLLLSYQQVLQAYYHDNHGHNRWVEYKKMNLLVQFISLLNVFELAVIRQDTSNATRDQTTNELDVTSITIITQVTSMSSSLTMTEQEQLWSLVRYLPDPLHYTLQDIQHIQQTSTTLYTMLYTLLTMVDISIEEKQYFLQEYVKNTSYQSNTNGSTKMQFTSLSIIQEILLAQHPTFHTMSHTASSSTHHHAVSTSHPLLSSSRHTAAKAVNEQLHASTTKRGGKKLKNLLFGGKSAGASGVGIGMIYTDTVSDESLLILLQQELIHHNTLNLSSTQYIGSKHILHRYNIQSLSNNQDTFYVLLFKITASYVHNPSSSSVAAAGSPVDMNKMYIEIKQLLALLVLYKNSAATMNMDASSMQLSLLHRCQDVLTLFTKLTTSYVLTKHNDISTIYLQQLHSYYMKLLHEFHEFHLVILQHFSSTERQVIESFILYKQFLSLTDLNMYFQSMHDMIYHNHKNNTSNNHTSSNVNNTMGINMLFFQIIDETLVTLLQNEHCWSKQSQLQVNNNQLIELEHTLLLIVNVALQLLSTPRSFSQDFTISQFRIFRERCYEIIVKVLVIDTTVDIKSQPLSNATNNMTNIAIEYSLLLCEISNKLILDSKYFILDYEVLSNKNHMNINLGDHDDATSVTNQSVTTATSTVLNPTSATSNSAIKRLMSKFQLSSGHSTTSSIIGGKKTLAMHSIPLSFGSAAAYNDIIRQVCNFHNPIQKNYHRYIKPTHNNQVDNHVYHSNTNNKYINSKLDMTLLRTQPALLETILHVQSLALGINHLSKRSKKLKNLSSYYLPINHTSLFNDTNIYTMNTNTKPSTHSSTVDNAVLKKVLDLITKSGFLSLIHCLLYHKLTYLQAHYYPHLLQTAMTTSTNATSNIHGIYLQLVLIYQKNVLQSKHFNLTTNKPLFKQTIKSAYLLSSNVVRQINRMFEYTTSNASKKGISQYNLFVYHNSLYSMSTIHDYTHITCYLQILHYLYTCNNNNNIVGETSKIVSKLEYLQPCLSLELLLTSWNSVFINTGTDAMDGLVLFQPISGSNGLSHEFIVAHVMRYFIRSLHAIYHTGDSKNPSEVFIAYIPQLVQLLRYDHYGYLIEFLFSIALKHSHFCHLLYWTLQTESSNHHVFDTQGHEGKNSSTPATKKQSMFNVFSSSSTTAQAKNTVVTSDTRLIQRCIFLLDELKAHLSKDQLTFLLDEISFFNGVTQLSHVLYLRKFNKTSSSSVDTAHDVDADSNDNDTTSVVSKGDNKAFITSILTKDFISRLSSTNNHIYLPFSTITNTDTTEGVTHHRLIVDIDCQSIKLMQSAAKCPFLLTFHTSNTVPTSSPTNIQSDNLKSATTETTLKTPVKSNAIDDTSFEDSPGHLHTPGNKTSNSDIVIRSKVKKRTNSLAINTTTTNTATNSLSIFTSPTLINRSSSISTVPSNSLLFRAPKSANSVQYKTNNNSDINTSTSNVTMNLFTSPKKLNKLSQNTITNTITNATTTSTVTNRYTDSCIFKVHDDIRQDVLVMQVMVLLQRYCLVNHIGVFFAPYGVISNRVSIDSNGVKDSALGGIIQVIPQVKSRDQLGKAGIKSLLQYYIQQFGDVHAVSFAHAQRNFVRSLAGYSVLCYLLHIKDRHNGNILIDSQGHIVHIDFGFILGISPGGNLGFETAPFKLSTEMIQLLLATNNIHTLNNNNNNHHNNINYNNISTNIVFQEYVKLTIQCFLAARHIYPQVFSIISCYLASSLACFQYKREDVLKKLTEKFMLHLDDLQAAKYIEELIHKAIKDWTTSAYDGVQKLQNDIYAPEW